MPPSPRAWREELARDTDHALRFGLSSHGLYRDDLEAAEDALRQMSLKEEFPCIESVETRRYRRWKAEQEGLRRAA